ncbi:hypothetical protein SAMN05421541_108369 [Actinoplanes philippinensis]|uniref:Uncharacterized protein n=1 Tax=Actinoplanes philippinensis TaxID=35752 RepID=A0A1I2HMY6_9ACTN|nr:hypothetical protein SAMN05421541_108369 [Actinoplanes philippinensis]
MSVEVREHDISGRGGYLLTENARIWLCDEDGTWYEHDVRLTQALNGGAIGIDADAQFDHRVVFQVYEHARPHLVRVGNGYGEPAAGDWKVD